MAHGTTNPPPPPPDKPIKEGDQTGTSKESSSTKKEPEKI